MEKKDFEKIKIVMCDVDGTLLTDNGIVSPKTLEVIRKVTEKGILFGLCTGRDMHSVKELVKKWGIVKYVDVIVGTGGSEICDFTKNVEKIAYPLAGELIKDIIKHYEDLDVNFVVPDKGILCVPKNDEHIRLLAELDGVEYKVLDFEEFLKEPRQKLMIMTNPEIMKDVIERSKTFKNEKYKSASLKTASVLYEYMDPRISKTYGLQQILDLHNFSMENLCVFGDEDNDYDMVKNAGIGVVMGNGSKLMKSMADFITEDNNSDGIGVFLEKYIL